jgi:hyperosmotically inducible periplasmic protein
MTSQQLSWSTIGVSLFAALALVACERADHATAGLEAGHTTAQVEKLTAPAAAEGTSDASISSAIAAQLARDGALDPTRIDIDTAKGRVVLRGSAPDDAAKERAKRIALGVDGVKGVDNYLTVSSS